MDAYEATRVVFSRIQGLDPDNAAKIMGFLLIQDHGDKDMIRLAFGPDSLLHSLVLKCRKDLGIISPAAAVAAPFLLHRQSSSPRMLGGLPLSSSPTSWAPPPPFSRNSSCNGRVNFGEEFQGSDELVPPFGAGDEVSDQIGPKDGDLAAEYAYWAANGQHRRNCTAADAAEAAGWRSCLYFARGFCKNGGSCRFVHGAVDDVAAEQQCQELLLQRSRSPRFAAAAAFPYSPTGQLTPTTPSSPSANCINFLLQQDSQRAAAAAAAALILGGDDARSYMGRPRMERSEFTGMLNPGSRQIYLTFPADSTFREEDVSNYFSIYGPVQDVRIPYQQKRMFGFVTFVYPETVKLILAKGNPHFVCDARVLVKPYKEKGKVPDKFRKPQHFDMGDLASPTGLDAADPFAYDLQNLGARLLYNRRKLELQQAIELQSRRFADLHLDLEGHGISSPTTALNGGFISTPEQSPSPEDMSPSPAAAAVFSISQAANRVLSGGSAHGLLRRVSVNGGSNEAGSDLKQLSAEHNLPDSPFASPSRAFGGAESFSSSSSSEAELTSGSPHSDTSGCGNDNLSSTIDTAPFKSCFMQIPRFSSAQGTVGL